MWRARIEPGAWDYYAGGAGDERSLAENRAAWDRIRLLPRVLVDVSRRDPSTPNAAERRSRAPRLSGSVIRGATATVDRPVAGAEQA